MATNKRRRTVEIYFVLYLAALVFLLPDKRDIDRYFLNNLGTPIFQPMFTLLPEKTTLTCRAIFDSTGPKILALDSINTIFYSGDVENVNFEFEIEDQTLRQSIKLTSNKNPSTKLFKYFEHKDQQAATFQWSPSLHERVSKTFLVRVIATAQSRGNNPIFLGQKNPANQPQTFRVQTQFSLLLIYLNPTTGIPMFPQQNQQMAVPFDSSSFFLNNFTKFLPQSPRGNITLSVNTSELRTIAYSQWKNIIYVGNADLKDPSIVKEINIYNTPDNNNKGEASILDVVQNTIIIHGKTPSYGRTKVVVKVRRKSDDKSASCDFTVYPLLLEQPDCEKFMYPDQFYTIDPKLPLTGIETKAFLKDGNAVRARSIQGEKFQFMPDISDTGKTFYLERYIDNNILGQPVAIRIMLPPDPEILDVNARSLNEVDVQTRAFGLINRERNEVVRFEVKGNARYEDKRGRLVDAKDPVRTQHFIFTPSNPNKPFEFKIIAVDKRGKKSFEKSWKKD